MAQPNSKQPVIQNFGGGGSHSRSTSQPPFFSNNCLPPLSPSPHSESLNSCFKDVSLEEIDVSSQGASAYAPAYTRENNAFRGNESLPPRRGHRRSSSDTVPLAFSSIIQSSPQLVPISGQRGVQYARDDGSVKDMPILLQRKEMDVKCEFKSNAEGMGERKSDGEVIDELFNSYMNLDVMNAWNSSLNERKVKDSTVTATKASGSESSNTETESVSRGNIANSHGTSSREGVKRSAATDIAPSTRHFRSRSMDSAFGSLNLDDEPSKLQASLGIHVNQLSPGNSVSEDPGACNLEFGNGEFSEAELKKIMSDERLAEVAISDPKRAKRILANRQSAARSKERKLRYISELEHKVQTLQTETTTLTAQHTVLQKDFTELTNQNNELKFRLQAMEQQTHLRDALHEALTAEVQRLKLATMELREQGRSSNYFPQHNSNRHHMFPMQHEQPGQQNQSSVATSTTATGSTTPTWSQLEWRSEASPI
ncbi:DNA-binding transcription factor [Lithospermum erythrorhizon]|uniref:DNA-binding transcription factor n=1 Tax=Lithospermum erythrorhizon TaxID=34254 RepID=A0AAV3R6P6_LITER